MTSGKKIVLPVKEKVLPNDSFFSTRANVM
jgi:hypothetical protein